MNHVLSAPLDVQIELTSDCNHRCGYCYNYWRHGSDRDFLSLGYEQLNHIFGELKKNQIMSVTITGGEPFLFPDKVVHCLSIGKTMGLQVDINSNLSTVSEKTLNLILGVGRPSIMTSVYSYRQGLHDRMVNSEGALVKTTQAIKIFIANGLRVSVNMVLTKQNLDDIFTTAKFVNDLGVTTFSGTRSLPPTGIKESRQYCLSIEQLKLSLDSLMKVESELGMRIEILNCYPKCTLLASSAFNKFLSRICVAGQTTLTIGADGGVRPCSHSDRVYGNIFVDSLSKIWGRMSDWRDNSLLPVFCNERCSLKSICGGGCRVFAQDVAGFKEMDPDAEPENLNKPEFFSNKETLIFSRVPNLDGKNFKINSSINFRREAFGGIVYLSGTRNKIFLNSSAFEFLSRCYAEKVTLSVASFTSSSNAKSEDDFKQVRMLFYRLVMKKILITSD